MEWVSTTVKSVKDKEYATIIKFDLAAFSAAEVRFANTKREKIYAKNVEGRVFANTTDIVRSARPVVRKEYMLFINGEQNEKSCFSI